MLQTELKKLLELFSDGTSALYLSGGRDSLLLLHLLLEAQKPFGIVSFTNSFTREQKKHIDKIIYEQNLLVFSYPPTNAYLIGKDKKVTMVEEYLFLDGSVKPFLRDCLDTPSKCVYETEFGSFIDTAPAGFKLNIFGTRKTDKHWATGKVGKEKLVKNGKFVYYNPLWDWTRKDVAEGLRFLKVDFPKTETGDVPLCLKCLTATAEVECPKTGQKIAPFDWNGKKNLELFQEKYSYQKESKNGSKKRCAL